MKSQYKIALYTKTCTLFYNEDCNVFGEKHGTIYSSRRKATEKLEYAMKYGTSLSGIFTVVKV